MAMLLSLLLHWLVYIVIGLVLLLAVLVLLLSLYLVHLHHKYSHIPSPKRSSFFWGHLSDIIALRKHSGNEFEPISTIFRKWASEVGPFFVIFFFFRPIVFTLNPEDVKKVSSDENISKPMSTYRPIGFLFGQRFLGNGLLTLMDYETWKPRRRLYDPSFKRSSLKELLPVFNKCVDTFLEKLSLFADGKTEVPMKEALHEAALDVISKVGFSADFQETCPLQNLGFKYLTDIKLSHLASMSLKGLQRSFTVPVQPIFKLFHPVETAMYQETALAMRKIGRDCIEKRIKAVNSGEQVPNDILTQILHSIGSKDNDMDMELLLDDFVTFYIAGQETTANTLSFAIILIHQHPDVLNKLLTEIEDVLGNRKDVTGEDLNKLKYTEQVINEVLRMYPPVQQFNKESPKGGIVLSGYHVPEGGIIFCSTAVLCRNPEYFEDPDSFDPSRFDADRERPGPFVYFPFSVGHRSCIGRQFAMIEAKMTLARLLQTYKLTLPPSYKLVVQQLTTQQPKGVVPCTLQKV